MHREADIALQIFRPVRGNLVAQKIADLPLGLYAPRGYLDRARRPEMIEHLMRLDFVGYGQGDTMQRVMAAQGGRVVREMFPTRGEDQLVNWALVCAGCGVGGFQRVIGDAEPRVQHIGLVHRAITRARLLPQPSRKSPSNPAA